MKEHKIGVDCRLSGLKHAGIGRYIESLLIHLLSINNKKVKLILFFHDETQAKEVLKDYFKKENKQINSINFSIIYTPIKHYSLAEQYKLPRIFTKENLDLLHVPHFNIPVFYKGKIITTIHDLLWHQQKGKKVTTLNSWKYWPKYLGYKFVASQAIKKSLSIIVPTNTIKQTLISYYPKSKNKIIVTKEGVNQSYKKQPRFSKDNKQKALQINKKQLIYTGSLYPHKNINLVLKSLKKLSDYKLIIVGSRNVFQDDVRSKVEELDLTNQVEFAGYVKDEDLVNLYHNSFALVQPSFSEGFGLPGVEAMTAGIPVLASDIPIFREVYQSGAIFFDPHSVDSFINTVKKLEKDDRNKRIILGKEIASQYNWQSMAEKTLSSYINLI